MAYHPSTFLGFSTDVPAGTLLQIAVVFLQERFVKKGRERVGLLKAVFYSLQRRNSNAPLVPPKPNEFDMAYSISALRAWFGTKSIASVSGS
jgi:hypothetical protein